MNIWLLIPIGFVIGLIGSMFGIGGGLFVVPVLHFGFKVPLHQAIACSLLTIVASSMMATMSKVRNGVTNIRLSKALEIPSISGAIFGSAVVGAMPLSVLKIMFSAVAVAMAVDMFKNPVRVLAGGKERVYTAGGEGDAFADSFRDKATGRTVRYQVKNLKWAVPVSLTAGFLSSTLGIGGGVINVPLITNVCKAPVKVASATSSYKLGLTACAGSIMYFKQGYIIPDVTIMMVLGILAGAYVGMNILLRVKAFYIELLFGMLMLGVAVKMLMSL
ncbi:MAG: sulfite exporter TauE/SafE family protein [Elusimicrobia bacterium]|nr:sulfite exporter TauE/SafE family protein [Elusimicrobiota bacterium]